MRKPIVAGNWKMNGRVGEAIDLAAEVKTRVGDADAVEVVLCPPFTALKPVGDLVRFSSVQLGAQDAHWEPQGAYTGEDVKPAPGRQLLVELLIDCAPLRTAVRFAHIDPGDRDARRGAHRNHKEMAEVVRNAILKSLDELDGLSSEVLLERRQQRLASFGQFKEA